MCSRARPFVLLVCVLASPIGCNGKRDRNESIIFADTRSAICSAQPCGGDRPVIEVYRDRSGKVKKLYRLHGSCFHSPGIYFEPDGKQTEVIPETPVTPGSPEANEFEARHQKQIGGLTKTDWIRCSDGMRLPPPK